MYHVTHDMWHEPHSGGCTLSQHVSFLAINVGNYVISKKCLWWCFCEFVCLSVCVYFIFCAWFCVCLIWLMNLKIWQETSKPFRSEQSNWSLKIYHITTAGSTNISRQNWCSSLFYGTRLPLGQRGATQRIEGREGGWGLCSPAQMIFSSLPYGTRLPLGQGGAQYWRY